MEVFTFSPREGRYPVQGNSFVMKMSIISDSPSSFLDFFSSFNCYKSSVGGIKDYIRSGVDVSDGLWFLYHSSDDFCIEMSSSHPTKVFIKRISPHLYQRMGIVGRKVGGGWEVVIDGEGGMLPTLLRNMDGQSMAGSLLFHYVGNCVKFPFMESKTAIAIETMLISGGADDGDDYDVTEKQDLPDFNEWIGFVHLGCNIISSSTIDPFISTFRPCKEKKYSSSEMTILRIDSPFFLADWIIKFFTTEQDKPSVKCMAASTTNTYAFSIRDEYELCIIRQQQ